ncbi:hypothetical protein PMAYCL1PPCAC_03398 [Pristionchus mayeri]|uniref:Mitochondrial import receptor subunit TOM22 homolog n=1 Tax=Pristionchus mayeri TaxID=1317129 RepID=A0AAN4Z321_9BILA|nr:hypothetical protein PMAYCL1PPCAC_03398 [Pristionchus mayeri]
MGQDVLPAVSGGGTRDDPLLRRSHDGGRQRSRHLRASPHHRTHCDQPRGHQGPGLCHSQVPPRLIPACPKINIIIIISNLLSRFYVPLCYSIVLSSFCDRPTMSYRIRFSQGHFFLFISLPFLFGISWSMIVDNSVALRFFSLVFASGLCAICSLGGSCNKGFSISGSAPFDQSIIEMAVVIPAANRPRDEWDEIPDEELEETMLERLEGLAEAVPESLRNAVSATASWSTSAFFGTLAFTRSAVWVVATTSLIMFLPYIIEKERADMEKTQMAQQRQMLLGPAAAQMQQKK